MKSLSELLNGLTGIHILGDKNCAIEGIAFDSRKVLPGTLFAALPGSNVDGHQFISSAIQNGAVAVLCEKLPENPDPGITWIKVDNVTSAFGFLTSNFFGNPSLAQGQSVRMRCDLNRLSVWRYEPPIGNDSFAVFVYLSVLTS